MINNLYNNFFEFFKEKGKKEKENFLVYYIKDFKEREEKNEL